ncbi:MAG: outer membrane beta-barrel domain-containing protein [Bdellovibrionales bacterium]|nr:outer membrane beta-barrel domain-containing protein [Bdellovibrionales bacterium]
MIIRFFVFLLAVTSFSTSYADDVDQIENLFDADDTRVERESQQEVRDAEAASAANRADKSPPPTRLENLNTLKSFEDVAVIQKRYLPKTQRFEGNFSAAANINDSYFSAYGVNGTLGYHFNEKFAAELAVKWFSVSNSKAANNLLEQGIVTNGLVATEMFYGVNMRWTPIYGKYSYFDKKIIPFDHYFAVGIGQTRLEAGSSSSNTTVNVEALDNPITLSLSTGQIIAFNKWMAFKWDVSWHILQPEVRTTRNGVSNVSDDLQNNIFLSLGFSFFFPEAKYR